MLLPRVALNKVLLERGMAKEEALKVMENQINMYELIISKSERG